MKRLSFFGKTVWAPSREAGQKSSILRFATRFAAAKRVPKSGPRCTAPGTRWAGTAPAPCCSAISSAPIIALTICVVCENCRIETGGFTGFIPFAFEPDGARPVLHGIPHATAFEELRNLAISRIFLDNIPHVTAYWISLGLPLAQLSLSYGVDDLHGTIIEEKIFHMAGARTPQQQTVEALEKAIREAGRVPMQRDSFYERISNTMSPAAASRGSVSSFDSALAGLRIGPVSYLNSKPLIWGLNPALLDTDVPAELSRKFFAGELDVALLPVFEILRAGGARIVDDVAIACRGEVYSVIVASRTAFRESGTIYLDPASRSSSALLRVLMAEYLSQGSLDRPRRDDSRRWSAALDWRCGDRISQAKWHRLALSRPRTALATAYGASLCLCRLGRFGAGGSPVFDTLRRVKAVGLAARKQIALREPDPDFALRYLTKPHPLRYGRRRKNCDSPVREPLAPPRRASPRRARAS